MFGVPTPKRLKCSCGFGTNNRDKHAEHVQKCHGGNPTKKKPGKKW